jgi:hypothetical protein
MLSVLNENKEVKYIKQDISKYQLSEENIIALKIIHPNMSAFEIISTFNAATIQEKQNMLNCK